MATINSLLSDLDERTIAQRIGILHDEIRMQYHLQSNTVSNFSEFNDIISNYYNYHFTKCMSFGGRMSVDNASSEAKEVLNSEYRRRNGDIVSAYNDAHDGTNGGLRSVLDIIADALKARAVKNYVQAAFDRHVTPNSWDEKVDIIQQFISHYGYALSSSIVTSQPERYAQNYDELIRAYVEGLKQTSSIFRRL